MTSPIRSIVGPARFLLAAIVALTTFAVVGHAVQNVTTPNSASFTYSLAPGDSGANITPTANVPTLILGDQTGVASDTDDVGSSLMTVVNSTQDRELVWNGFESNKGGLTSGFSPTAGTHIMYIDFSHLVDLEVTNGTSFHVQNSSTNTVTANGNVTLIW
jgi:hypothetical protein